jgi:hypothetical protein
MTEHPNPWDCDALKQSVPVAWKFHLDGADQVVLDEDADAQMRDNGRALVYAAPPAQGEPVALKRYDFYCSYDGGGPAEAEESPHGMYVLYEDVAPPAPTLTDDQIMEISEKHWVKSMYGGKELDEIAFARAVLAARGTT